MFIQVVKMSDEVTVSSLPHPISMFFLGIFAVTIIFMLVEVYRFRKEMEKQKKFLEEFPEQFNEFRNGTENKILEISKKVDSRVDKALSSLKKTKLLND